MELKEGVCLVRTSHIRLWEYNCETSLPERSSLGVYLTSSTVLPRETEAHRVDPAHAVELGHRWSHQQLWI